MHEVDNHIEDFLNKFKEILDNMTTEEFDTLVKEFYSTFLFVLLLSRNNNTDLYLIFNVAFVREKDD